MERPKYRPGTFPVGPLEVTLSGLESGRAVYISGTSSAPIQIAPQRAPWYFDERRRSKICSCGVGRDGWDKLGVPTSEGARFGISGKIRIRVGGLLSNRAKTSSTRHATLHTAAFFLRRSYVSCPGGEQPQTYPFPPPASHKRRRFKLPWNGHPIFASASSAVGTRNKETRCTCGRNVSKRAQLPNHHPNYPLASTERRKALRPVSGGLSCDMERPGFVCVTQRSPQVL